MSMRHGRQGHALVAFAGPASNLVVALMVAIVIRILRFDPEVWSTVLADPLGEMLLNAVWLLLSLNILLFIFNLLPVPPLDGWSVLKGVVPASVARQMEELEFRYANVIPMVFFGVIIIIVVTGGSLLGTIISSIRSFLVGF